MYATWITYFILVIAPFTDSVMLDNQFCNVRPAVVSVDPINHDYFPYFVILNRCSGSCNTVPPNIFHCVAKTQKDVVLDAFSILSGSLEQVIMKNDTSCNCECVVKEDQCDKTMEVYKPDRCRCECKFNETGIECAQNFRWNQEHCECLCDLEPQPCRDNMIWSPQDCRCQCSGIDQKRCLKRGKVLDEEDCVCVDVVPEFGQRTAEQHSKWDLSPSLAAVVVIAMLIEIAIIFIVADLYFNFCKKKSFIRLILGLNKTPDSGKDENLEMDNSNHNLTSNGSQYETDKARSYEVLNRSTNKLEINTDL